MSFDPLGPLHAQPRLVTFMTDFGLRDPSAGVLSGVVLGIAPEARTLDLTHAIPPYDVEAGAEALVESLVHLPIGAHVAVVDPGVGTQRRPIAIRCGRGDALIGPDNGLLLPAAAALGGAVAAVILDDERWWGSSCPARRPGLSNGARRVAAPQSPAADTESCGAPLRARLDFGGGRAGARARVRPRGCV
jgi:hypothetical protein